MGGTILQLHILFQWIWMKYFVHRNFPFLPKKHKETSWKRVAGENPSGVPEHPKTVYT